MMELTNTNLRYLLAIYDLSRMKLEVSSKDIAQMLDVSRASVTSMMTSLVEKQLVAKERYGKVHLTGQGRQLAHLLAIRAQQAAQVLGEGLELTGEEAWRAACAAVSQLPGHCLERGAVLEALPA